MLVAVPTGIAAFLWTLHPHQALSANPPTADQTTNRAAIQDKTVRMIYLVSQDREARSDYHDAIENAIKSIRSWYGKQLNGPTFKLHDPIVEVVHSDKTADWFTRNPNGENQDDWGFNNALAEGRRLLGARQGDPHYIWVLYSDGPGNKGRGGGSVAYLPEDDLLGLIGRHPTQKDPLRWVAGLGHELGHAFGLPHPADIVRDADALMWAGFYGKYPDKTYLTELDKSILLHSPFFFDATGKSVVTNELFTEKYTYAGGYFGKIANGTPPRWKEGKSDSSETYYFEELRRDKEIILLRDSSRSARLEIPINGGASRFSPDDGATWQPLYDVRKEP